MAPTSGVGADRPSIDYKRIVVKAAPQIVVLMAVSVVGFYFVRTWWWVVVFVMGSLAALTNQVYLQKTLDLRDRLRE